MASSSLCVGVTRPLLPSWRVSSSLVSEGSCVLSDGGGLVKSSEAGGELAPAAPASVLAEQALQWENCGPRGVTRAA